MGNEEWETASESSDVLEVTRVSKSELSQEAEPLVITTATISSSRGPKGEATRLSTMRHHQNDNESGSVGDNKLSSFDDRSQGSRREKGRVMRNAASEGRPGKPQDGLVKEKVDALVNGKFDKVSTSSSTTRFVVGIT